MAGLGLALSGLSLAGNVFGNIMSARKNKEIDTLLSERMNDLQSRFDKDYNTNFLETEQGRSVIKALGNRYDKQTKKIDNAAVVGGASPEAKIASRESAQGTYDEALTRLAGYGTQYKDMKEREFNRRDDALKNFYLQHEMKKGENWANLMGNAGNLAQTGIMADAMGGGGAVFPRLGGLGNAGVEMYA